MRQPSTACVFNTDTIYRIGNRWKSCNVSLSAQHYHHIPWFVDVCSCTSVANVNNKSRATKVNEMTNSRVYLRALIYSALLIYILHFAVLLPEYGPPENCRTPQRRRPPQDGVRKGIVTIVCSKIRMDHTAFYRTQCLWCYATITCDLVSGKSCLYLSYFFVNHYYWWIVFTQCHTM